MPRGDKSSYTDKQKRKAQHIEEGYEDRGISHDEAERRAWASSRREQPELFAMGSYALETSATHWTVLRQWQGQTFRFDIERPLRDHIGGMNGGCAAA